MFTAPVGTTGADTTVRPGAPVIVSLRLDVPASTAPLSGNALGASWRADLARALRLSPELLRVVMTPARGSAASAGTGSTLARGRSLLAGRSTAFAARAGMQAQASRATVPACTPVTPVGARCRVATTLPSVPPGVWPATATVNTSAGTQTASILYLARPALAVTGSGTRCVTRGGTTAGTVRVGASGRSVVGVAVQRVIGSAALACRGTGVPGSGAVGRRRHVQQRIPRGTYTLDRLLSRSGFRDLGRGTYRLRFIAAQAGAPSIPADAYVRIN